VGLRPAETQVCVVPPPGESWVELWEMSGRGSWPGGEPVALRGALVPPAWAAAAVPVRPPGRRLGLCSCEARTSLGPEAGRTFGGDWNGRSQQCRRCRRR
jgi:hypothetical protein